MAVSNSYDHLSNRMKLEWHSKLNTDMVPMKNFRRTSIIGTIGKFPSLFLFSAFGGGYAPENFLQDPELICNAIFRPQNQRYRQNQCAP